MDHDALLERNFRSSIAAKEAFLGMADRRAEFARAVGLVVDRYRAGGRLYIAGNGGSAADAQHLAAEFVSKLARDRAPLPAEALTVDSSVLTAIGNDYGFEKVFARQLEGKATTKDVFLGITTSGNSANIVAALHASRRIGMSSVAFSGHDGGAVRSLADVCIVACGHATATIQELHIVLAHTLCEAVELALFD
ncbi:MAG TPA: SIS domain-containing protein [Burkholderiaceae bacterium]|nr:SIS domain-containing protein [Burkholderiaceae bacterium]